ncbi:radical SAM protein [Candidatus Lokiarchaeum ossiferum]|uniref:radical SAM protein n=1 Tax=Candidatus Lokiarchaeum ossiferum TaxID=2951803 RepID=UPI00352DE5C3
MTTSIKKTAMELVLETKITLLCEGIIISQDLIEDLKRRGIQFNLGRKGGAGPAGGRYFKFSTGTLVSTPIWIDDHQDTTLIIQDILPTNEVIYTHKTQDDKILPKLFLLPVPHFYSKKTSDSIPYSKIALIHGDETLATTINQRCKYWRGDQQCKFCGIEFSLANGATTEIKTAAQLVETISEARKENSNFAKHLTLTVGTSSSPDKGIAQYIPILKILKSSFSEIQIHIQIEPMADKSWYKQAHDAGADTIGIHLEILDSELRNQICPGKSKISFSTYIEHWYEANRIFGKNQVSTFVITGFESNLEKFKTNLTQVIEAGAIPLITPARYIQGVQIRIPQTDSRNFSEIVRFAAQECKRVGLNPLKNKAGCIRCGGCSPINEAYAIIDSVD